MGEAKKRKQRLGLTKYMQGRDYFQQKDVRAAIAHLVRQIDFVGTTGGVCVPCVP